jgi:hypothetical protein
MMDRNKPKNHEGPLKISIHSNLGSLKEIQGALTKRHGKKKMFNVELRNDIYIIEECRETPKREQFDNVSCPSCYEFSVICLLD